MVCTVIPDIGLGTRRRLHCFAVHRHSQAVRDIDSMLLCVNTKDRWVLICHHLSSLLALLQFPIFWRCPICATYFQVGITSYQNRDHEMQAETKQDHLGLRTHRSLSPCELTSCEAGSDPKYILVDFHSGKSDCQRPQTAKALGFSCQLLFLKVYSEIMSIVVLWLE